MLSLSKHHTAIIIASGVIWSIIGIKLLLLLLLVMMLFRGWSSIVSWLIRHSVTDHCVSNYSRRKHTHHGRVARIRVKMTARLLHLVLLVDRDCRGLIKLLLSLLNYLLLLMQVQKWIHSLVQIVHIEELLHLVGIVVIVVVWRAQLSLTLLLLSLHSSACQQLLLLLLLSELT